MSDAANATDLFKGFVEAINTHDLQALIKLMDPDHLFVDSLGNRVRGAEHMLLGWQTYFSLCPDYWIRIDNVALEGAIVLAVGEAGGTIDGIAWCTPAAWKAVVAHGFIVEWHVFADNKPVYEILVRRKPASHSDRGIHEARFE